MNREPRLATRAPDGQVLRAGDRVTAQAASALRHDLERSLGRAVIGERVLLPRVRELDAGTIILADGFSCREQIEMHSERRTTHVAELLLERMR